MKKKTQKNKKNPNDVTMTGTFEAIFHKKNKPSLEFSLLEVHKSINYNFNLNSIILFHGAGLFLYRLKNIRKSVISRDQW